MKNKYSGYLFDMAIPLIFFEWWNVLLAFIFIILIETYIVKYFIKEKNSRLFFILLKANLITTLAGYLVQGVLRIASLMLIFKITNQFFESYPILSGILGNVAIDKKANPITDLNVISAIITSIIITFIISFLIERKILLRSLKDKFDKKTITKSILIANIVSYILLTAWICLKYMLLD